MPASPEEFLDRLDHRDSTLWPEGNVSSSRLGWLDSPREMERQARDLAQWASTIDEETVVLLGMGGSSLGPLVLSTFAELFALPNRRRLIVLDTTDPETVAKAPIEDAFVIVSSKSGTTLEPNALFSYARSRLSDPKRYAVITDPGTPLAGEARELGVQRLFKNRADIGGRYSVLSYFGLVAAALCGYDIAELCGRVLDVDRIAAVETGLAMGSAARSGRDKVTIVVPDEQRSIGLWVEQLIAESTGKRGTGCVPVPTSETEEGEDRHLLPRAVKAAGELGAEFFALELAVAAAGHVLDIDPFDEPNVAESKANTNRVLSELPLPVVGATPPEQVEGALEELIAPRDYLSIQAYLPYGSETALETLRRRLRDRFGGLPVTAGYGPRFLHSTGQLHKGGPNEIVALQVVPRGDSPSLPIPGYPYDFGTLIRAQAIGDHESLLAHGRRVVRVEVEGVDELD